MTGYDRNGFRVFQVPCLRYESINCLLWHRANNQFSPMGDPLHNVCSECKKEAKRLVQNFGYVAKVSPEQKDSRCASSSNYPVSYHL